MTRRRFLQMMIAKTLSWKRRLGLKPRKRRQKKGNTRATALSSQVLEL
jgi:hypothetical protein